MNTSIILALGIFIFVVSLTLLIISWVKKGDLRYRTDVWLTRLGLAINFLGVVIALVMYQSPNMVLQTLSIIGAYFTGIWLVCVYKLFYLWELGLKVEL